MCESKRRGKTKFKQPFIPLNLAFISQLSFGIQFYFVAMKGSDKLHEWGKYLTNKTRQQSIILY